MLGTTRYCVQSGKYNASEYNTKKNTCLLKIESFVCSAVALLSHLRVLYSRTLPSKDLKKVADQFTKHNIQGLLIVGGFEVRTAVVIKTWQNLCVYCWRSLALRLVHGYRLIEAPQ